MNRTEFKARIEELRSLKRAEALDPDGLDWLEEAFETKYPDHLPLPRLAREYNGDVSLGWYEGGVDIDLDIGLKTKRAAYSEFQFDNGHEDGKHLDLSKDADWEWVVGRLFYWHSKSSAEQRKE